jgi:ligand-binding sensor domain-containing protein
MIAGIRLAIFFFCLALASQSQNYTSRLFSTEQGLPDTYVYSMLQDDKGFLWIATGKGLVKFDGQIFVSYDLQAEEGGDIVYSGISKQYRTFVF